MKKFLVLLLAMMMVLCLTACGSEEAVVEETTEAADSATTADISEADISQDELAALAEAYNEVAPIYNEAYTLAEENGWLADEQTAAELEAVGPTLSFIAAGLTEDPSLLDGSDFDALTSTIKSLAPALEDLVARVSVPYEG